MRRNILLIFNLVKYMIFHLTSDVHKYIHFDEIRLVNWLPFIQFYFHLFLIFMKVKQYAGGCLLFIFKKSQI